jgi:hypothetical protein
MAGKSLKTYCNMKNRIKNLDGKAEALSRRTEELPSPLRSIRYVLCAQLRRCEDQFCLQAMATIDRIRSALSFGAGVLSLLGIFVVIRQETLAEIWVPAFVGAAVMLSLKEMLRKFRRSYVTGCNSPEVDWV